MRGPLFFGLGMASALAAGWLALPRLLYVGASQPVAFRHKLHAGKSGSAQCADCHALAADGTFAGIPPTEVCAGCHAERVGASPAEARLVDGYIKKGLPVAWRSYSRQPANVWFSHAIHVRRAGLPCRQCHSGYGESNAQPPYERDRISGYSRQVMEMSSCEDCHRQRKVAAGCLGCHR